MEFLPASRHGEEQLGKTRRFQLLKLAQAVIFVGGQDDDGGLAVFRDSLRLAPRSLDDFAEPVLRVLHRPIAMSHGTSF